MDLLSASRVCMFVAGAATGSVVAQGPLQLGWPLLCRHVTELDWLRRPPRVGERCVQFSSYDRRCGTDPAAGDRWYANDDRGHYLRQVARDGATEHVMVDVDGPGYLARLWSANPHGQLHFDVDGERVWSVDFAALCRGEIAGAPAPLAAMRSRGGNVYLPVPFGKHLTVSAEAGDLYYLADVALYPQGSKVAPFVPGRPTAAAPWTVLASRYLTIDDRQFGVDRWRSAAFQCSTQRPGEPGRIGAGKMIVDLTGWVEAPQDMPAEQLGPLLDRVLLVVRCGDEETVRVPLASFFGGASAWRPWRSYMMGIDVNRRAWCRWPMPMPAGGSVALEVEGELDGVQVSIGGEIAPVGLPFEEPLLFRADYHLAKATPTRPFSDHVVLDAAGRGRFVGCSLLVRNPSQIWWGEGDERIWVDGEKFPSWWGTGTEDYFGYAWCDPTPFEAPFHAQVVCDGPMNFGFTQLFRAQVADNVPFQTRLRFELERWHWVEDLAVDYATVAYWYGEAGATSGLPPVPPAAERALPRLEPPKMLAVEDAIEGEALTVRSCSGGQHEAQNLAFFAGAFSHDAHRWWRDGAVGDKLVMVLPVAAAGRYRVRAAFVRADDFGVVQLSLGDAVLGSFDGYAETIGSSGPVELGDATLTAGEHELVLEIMGRNDKAKPRHMVGLDYLLLEKVE